MGPNPKPQTPNPKPQTPNPKLQFIHNKKHQCPIFRSQFPPPSYKYPTASILPNIQDKKNSSYTYKCFQPSITPQQITSQTIQHHLLLTLIPQNTLPQKNPNYS